MGQVLRWQFIDCFPKMVIRGRAPVLIVRAISGEGGIVDIEFFEHRGGLFFKKMD